MAFWYKPLQDLSQLEWEKLCDGCGQCCMHKFEDEDTGEILSTDIACRLFDADNCVCKDYEQRLEKVPSCLNIKHIKSEHYHWLPETCAYRLRFEGKMLQAWHPLVSGDLESIHEAGKSMRQRCVSEIDVPEEAWVDHIQDS